MLVATTANRVCMVFIKDAQVPANCSVDVMQMALLSGTEMPADSVKIIITLINNGSVCRFGISMSNANPSEAMICKAWLIVDSCLIVQR